MARRGLSLVLGAWERQSELVRRVHRILRRPAERMSGWQAAARDGQPDGRCAGRRRGAGAQPAGWLALPRLHKQRRRRRLLPAAELRAMNPEQSGVTAQTGEGGGAACCASNRQFRREAGAEERGASERTEACR